MVYVNFYSTISDRHWKGYLEQLSHSTLLVQLQSVIMLANWHMPTAASAKCLVWVYNLTIENTALKHRCRLGRSVGFIVWEGMCADIIWMSSRPVPNMSASQWSLPTADNMSGLILRLCLWCSLSVAHTEFLSISQTHTNTHTVWRSTHLYPAFCFSLLPLSFLIHFLYLPLIISLDLFFALLFFLSFSFFCLSKTPQIFPCEVYLFNSPQQQPISFSCCWLHHRTPMLDHIISVHVMRIRL